MQISTLLAETPDLDQYADHAPLLSQTEGATTRFADYDEEFDLCAHCGARISQRNAYKYVRADGSRL